MHQIFGKNLSSSKHVVCLFSVKPLHQNRPLHKNILKENGEMAMIAAPTIIKVWLSRKKMEIRANFPGEKKLVTSLKSWESNVLYMTIDLVWTSWWNGKLRIVLYGALLSLLKFWSLPWKNHSWCIPSWWTFQVQSTTPCVPHETGQKSLAVEKLFSVGWMVFCLLSVFHFHLEPDVWDWYGFLFILRFAT